MNGVLIIDKPAGLTSHDVVNRVRRIIGQRSVGHLGTLDPMATGVLPLVTGNFTRLAQFYIGSEKTYEGSIRFGFCTDTYDAEGEPTSEPTNVTLNPDELESAAAKFRGVIEQTPPPFSAKKIKGVPAYKLARKQKEVTLQPVQVEVKELEVLGVDVDRMRFRARVSSGTICVPSLTIWVRLWVVGPSGDASPHQRRRIHYRRSSQAGRSRRVSREAGWVCRGPGARGCVSASRECRRDS